MGRLLTSEFLSKVTTLLTETNGQSSIYITQKRLSYTPSIPVEPTTTVKLPLDQKTTIIKSEVDKDTYPLLIRITDGGNKDGKKVKLSTVVESDQLEAFWNDYANVLKNGCTGLLKKNKKKKKKTSGKVSKK